MLKYLLIIPFCSSLIFTANAQYVGLKGGLTLSNLNFDEVDDRNMRTGYNVGAYVNLPVSDDIAFQPEVNFTTKGATADFDVPIFRGEYSFNMNYIDVPLMGVFRLGDQVEIHLGPYIGFLMGVSLSTDGEFIEGEEALDKEDFQSLDFGLAGGLAVNFSTLQIGARYHYGLQEVSDSESTQNFYLGDARHSYLQVYGALRFGTYD